jgi:hypothetical protein
MNSYLAASTVALILKKTTIAHLFIQTGKKRYLTQCIASPVFVQARIYWMA